MMRYLLFVLFFTACGANPYVGAYHRYDGTVFHIDENLVSLDFAADYHGGGVCPLQFQEITPGFLQTVSNDVMCTVQNQNVGDYGTFTAESVSIQVSQTNFHVEGVLNLTYFNKDTTVEYTEAIYVTADGLRGR